MTEAEVEDLLLTLLSECCEYAEDPMSDFFDIQDADKVVRVQPFSRVGLMTSDRGILLVTKGSLEFQITIKRSR